MRPTAWRHRFRGPEPGRWPMVVTCLALSLAACHQAPEPMTSRPLAEVTFAAPVEVQLPAAGDIPALTIILAFNRGATIGGLLEPVGSAIYKALKACPQVVEAIAKGEVATVSFSVAQERISPQTPAGADVTETCLAAALGGDRLSTPPGMALNVRAQLLVTAPDGTTKR